MVDALLQLTTIVVSLITLTIFVLILFKKLKTESTLWRKPFLFQIISFSVYIFYFAINKGRCPFASTGEALLFISWFLSVFFFFLDRKFGDRSISFFVIPIISFLTIISFVLIRITSPLPEHFLGSIFPLHVSFILLSYVFFILSFTILAIQGKVISSLKSQKKGYLYHKLPTFSDLEKHINIFLLTSIILLPIGLSFGFIWALQENINTYLMNVKFLFSILTWCCFLLLFLYKKFASFSYKKNLIFSFMGVVFMLITFLVGNHAF